MAGDFSRSTVNRVSHYTGVLMQQGRVQVDADWNEQLALQLHRCWTETRDVIGRCGTPQSGSGFAISTFDNGADLLIHPGRFYVNGLLCELDPQAVPAWLPPSSSPPSSANIFYRMTAGQTLAGTLRKIEMDRERNAGAKFPVNASGQVVYIPSKTIDGRDLAADDWVEIFASGGASVTARVQTIGDPAAPDDPSFLVPSYYPVTVDHALASLANAGQLSLRRVVTFTTQPFLVNQWDEAVETSPLSSPPGLNLPDGDYLVVLEAWLREINALQDPHIREVALGGPDTCERLQTVWQVHVLPWSGESSPPGSPLPSPLPSPPSPLDCCSDFPSFDDYKASTRTTGLMNAQAPPPGNNVPPCQLPPSAGYLGLANQLYRVEIFRSGHFNDAATFVWSRDNAMVETPVVCIDASGNVYVSNLGTDDLHSFSLNDWVEIVDDDADLQGQPRFLAQISQPPASAAQPPCATTGVQAYQLILQPGAPARFQNKTNLRLRRWDMTDGQVALDASLNPIGIPIASGWTLLENNIQVNFSDGFFASRSFWQIPARTATGDIEWPPFDVPNSNPIPQPPLGPHHFFCRLAHLTVSAGNIQVADCRCTFPSLNAICAEVAQALDQRDALHRLQNRSLHGAGVVCGLSVTCPGANQSSTSVSVAPGYAIDCDGYDLILSQSAAVDLASLVDLSPQQDALPDGEYELLLERSGNPTRVCHDSAPASPPSDPCCSDTASAAGPAAVPVRFRVIPCAPETLGNEILDGTLLMDFYTRCLQPVINGVKSAYANQYLTGDNQVSDGQALLSALTNLVIQYVQAAPNRDVYISADEDSRLRNFYSLLAGLMNDCTYCSLTSGLPSYPEYPLSAPLATIYGKGYKTRFRISPMGNVAIACGSGSDLHFYNLSSGALVADITPPIPGDASGWTLQDVAFSPDGMQLYAMATGVNTQTSASDSLFAVGRVDGTTVTWTSQGSAGAQSYVTLAVSSQQPGVVYAVAPGAGLFAISFANGVNPMQLAQFNAIGHLVCNGGYLYATTIVPTQGGGNTYELQRYGVEAGAANQQPNMTCPLNGLTVDLTDDLAVGSFTNVPGAQISAAAFVSGYSSASATKQVVLFNASDKGEQVAQVDLGENTTVRLLVHPYGTMLFVSYESSSRLATVAGGANGLALTRYTPVELHPTSMAFGVAQDHFFVYTLNSTANTVSAMSADTPAFDAYPALEQYRADALRAFLFLAEAFLQYLKDCFCQLLLPACPACAGDAPEGKGVALACIAVLNGAVQKICNLEKRKIVKSFPTVGYWLSLIPVIPLFKAMVEKLCCLTLPGLFSKVNFSDAAIKPAGAASLMPTINLSSMSGENIRYALAQAGKINLSSAPSALLQKLAPAGQLTLDSMVSPFRQPSASAPAVSISQINGMSLDQAKAALQAANVQVAATETYAPANFTQNLGDYASAPASMPPGTSVTLVVDSSNTVRFYVPTAPAVQQLSTAVQTNQAAVETEISAATQATQQLQTRVAAVETAESPALENIQSLQNLVNSLQTQITNLQASQAGALAERDQQIAQLTAATQQMQTKLTAVDTLTTQVQAIEGRLPPAANS